MEDDLALGFFIQWLNLRLPELRCFRRLDLPAPGADDIVVHFRKTAPAQTQILHGNLVG